MGREILGNADSGKEGFGTLGGLGKTGGLSTTEGFDAPGGFTTNGFRGADFDGEETDPDDDSTTRTFGSRDVALDASDDGEVVPPEGERLVTRPLELALIGDEPRGLALARLLPPPPPPPPPQAVNTKTNKLTV